MSPDRIHISAAHRDDLAAIMALEGAGFPEAERWSERSWLGELLGDGRTVLIARAHAPVGVITVQTVGELADLHRLVVAPGYRRRGVGTQLTTAAVRAVRHLGARAMILEVDYTNDPAIALYARVGFEQLTARENYYGPGQHALIMKLYDLEAWTGPPECKP
ncbi:MAG TPA: GNAT family N-acetyltransferase [Propionibacteriaceae bacterium]|jgi:ribosomal-protein-alanine N-acetyltransferase|nr:GNAT family N-acetyltransferase [Propionibacteriaceae bacterium]